MNITLFLDLILIMTPRGEIPGYLSKIYLPTYFYCLSHDLPHTTIISIFLALFLIGTIFCGTIYLYEFFNMSFFDFCLTKNQGLGLFFTCWISRAEYILVSCAKFITKLCLFSIYTCLMWMIFSSFMALESCNSLMFTCNLSQVNELVVVSSFF